ncbi:MAG TPA: 30S ribosome-binding factor RbfA [Anaerolineae bacterium]
MASHRVERTAEQIRNFISDLMERRIKDPRLAMITITKVRLSPTMREATIFVSALGGVAVRRDVMDGLEHAKGYLRREVGQHLKLRNAPELYFKWDESLESGDHVLHMLDELKDEE